MIFTQEAPLTRKWSGRSCIWSNWNLEMLFFFFFQERRKKENSEKNLSVQGKEPNKLHSGLLHWDIVLNCRERWIWQAGLTYLSCNSEFSLFNSRISWNCCFNWDSFDSSWCFIWLNLWFQSSETELEDNEQIPRPIKQVLNHSGRVTTEEVKLTSI